MQAENHSYWQRIPEDSRDNTWSQWLKDRGKPYHSDAYNHWHRSFVQEDYRIYENSASENRAQWGEDLFYEPETDYPEYFTADGAYHQQLLKNANESSNEFQGFHHSNSFPQSSVYSYSSDSLDTKEESKVNLTSYILEKNYSASYNSSDKNDLPSSSFSVPSEKFFGRKNYSKNWVTLDEQKGNTNTVLQDKSKKTPFVEKSISNLISKLFSENKLLESNIAKKGTSSNATESLAGNVRRHPSTIQCKDKLKSRELPSKGQMGNSESLKRKDGVLNHWKMSARHRENHRNIVANSEYRIRRRPAINDSSKRELNDDVYRNSLKGRRLPNGINGNISYNVRDHKHHLNSSKALKFVDSKPKIPSSPVTASPKKEREVNVSPKSDVTSHSDYSDGPPLLSPQKSPKKLDIQKDFKQSFQCNYKLKELQSVKKRTKMSDFQKDEPQTQRCSQKIISNEGINTSMPQLNDLSKNTASSVSFEKISKLHDILSCVMKTSLSEVIRNNIDVNNELNESCAESEIKPVVKSEKLEDNQENSDSYFMSDSCHEKAKIFDKHFKVSIPPNCITHQVTGSLPSSEEKNINNKQNIFSPFDSKTELKTVLNKENTARKHFHGGCQYSTNKPSCQLTVVTRKQAALKALIIKQKLKKKRNKFKGGTYDLYLSVLKKKKKKHFLSESHSLDARDDTSSVGTVASCYSDDSFSTVLSSQTLPEMPSTSEESTGSNLSALSSQDKTSLSHVIKQEINSEDRTLSDSELELNKDILERAMALNKSRSASKSFDKGKKNGTVSNSYKIADKDLPLHKIENVCDKKKLLLKPEVRIEKISLDASKSSLIGLKETKQPFVKSHIEHLKSQNEFDKNFINSHSDVSTKIESSTVSLFKKFKTDGKGRFMCSRNSSRRFEVNKRYLRSSFKHERYSSIASGVKSRMRMKRKFPEDHIDMDAISFSSCRLKESDRKKKMKRRVNIQGISSHVRLHPSGTASSSLHKVHNKLLKDRLPKDIKKKKIQTDELKNENSLVKKEKGDGCHIDEKPYPVSMCTCLAKPLDNASFKVIGGLICCQAVDSIDGEMVPCSNSVTNHNLVRPSLKIPFTAMCEVHLLRLRHHQCCPSCGVFCTQGSFVQCVVTLPLAKNRQQIHFFHQQCQASQQRGLPPICPHCGNGSGCKVVRLELNNCNSSLRKSKYSLNTSEDEQKSVSLNNGMINVLQVSSDKNLHMQKGLSSDNLSFAPDKFQLQTLLSSLSCEKPLNLRYSGKSLFSTIKSGDVEKVLHMLSVGFDANHKFVDHHLSTPLHIAAAKGWSMIVHILVQYGASLDHMNDLLYTPLMIAIEKKHLDIVQYLIKAGAQLDARGEDGLTCLHVAAKCGSTEICKMLLKTGKLDINIQDDGGWTSLVWAAEYKHIEVVKSLLNHGADPNIRDNEENIALHWSSYSGNVDICQLFLDVGCELMAANKHGDTPLHVAARQYSYECVVLFLARGANPEIKNVEGETPIMCCQEKDSQTWMALSMNQELKRRRANIKHRGEQIMSQDISRGKEKNQIQCVNDVDDEPCPTDFLYVLENCETTPIDIDRTITSLQSCRCKDECTSQACTCSSISLKCWYDRDGILLPDFNILDPPMVFECNRACLCWQTCKNRVVQKGIVCRLQLFRTKHKGWGVRTLKDIPKGVFICEYVGEIISDSEADIRDDDSYLFDLDNRDGDTYCLDARFYGNISRFINHHCEPNLVPVKVFIEHQDLCFPRISFFSTREIKAYEELGFDYGEKFWVVKCKRFLCVCGSSHCKYSKDAIDDTLERYYKQLGDQLSHEESIES